MRPDSPQDFEPTRAGTKDDPVVYADVGCGPCLMMVHGVPGSMRDFRWLVPELVSWARVLVVDLPGFGAAADTPRGCTLEDQADYLDAVVAHAGVDTCWVIGHSFGAAPAAAFAARNPDRVLGCGFISPVCRQMHRGLRRFVGRALLRRLGQLPWVGPRVLERLRRQMISGGFHRSTTLGEVVRVLDLLAAFSFAAYRQFLGQLGVPTWVVHADDDPLIESDLTVSLAESLPNCSYTRFESGGHNPQKHLACEIATSLRSWVLGDDARNENV